MCRKRNCKLNLLFAGLGLQAQDLRFNNPADRQ
jgi:hypothetical protein